MTLAMAKTNTSVVVLPLDLPDRNNDSCGAKKRLKEALCHLIHVLFTPITWFTITCISPRLYTLRSDAVTRPYFWTHTMAPVATRSSIFRLINASQHSACPCHGCKSAAHNHAHHGALALNQLRKFATPVQTVEKEYAFEVCTF